MSKSLVAIIDCQYPTLRGRYTRKIALKESCRQLDLPCNKLLSRSRLDAGCEEKASRSHHDVVTCVDHLARERRSGHIFRKTSSSFRGLINGYSYLPVEISRMGHFTAEAGGTGALIQINLIWKKRQNTSTAQTYTMDALWEKSLGHFNTTISREWFRFVWLVKFQGWNSSFCIVWANEAGTESGKSVVPPSQLFGLHTVPRSTAHTTPTT